MILEKSLEKFGLTQKEARIYLAVLELGQDTVLNIAKKSEQKRPITYVALDSLIKKGLIQKIPRGTTTLYSAENPDHLIDLLAEKETELKKAIPLLKALYNVRGPKPQIKFYEGKEGLKKIYKILHQAENYINFYGSIKDIIRHFPESFLTVEQIKKMNIPVKEIVSSDTIDINYAKKIVNFDNPKHDARTLKKGTTFILDSAIFDNKLAIISLKGNFFGVLIESKDIANSFKILYELAWQSAEPIK